MRTVVAESQTVSTLGRQERPQRTRGDDLLPFGRAPLPDRADRVGHAHLVIERERIRRAFSEPFHELIRPVAHERGGTDDDGLVDELLVRQRRLAEVCPHERDALELGDEPYRVSPL